MTTLTSQDYINLEDEFGAHNYHPIDVVIDKGKGVWVWDVEGKKYLDFLSAYSAVNQGHCHPKIVNALIEQSQKLTLTSRAFYNSCLGEYEKYITEYFGYDKVLPMNTGVEGDETAFKLARKWAYAVKGIPENKAKIIFCEGNFHGRTMMAVSASNDPDCKDGYGPYLPGIELIPFNNIPALETALQDPNVCAFLVEPIQGEAGVMVPDEGYLKKAYDLCKSNNVLFIADEVQTGWGRTGGKWCGIEQWGVEPDIMTFAKGLANGVPIGATIATPEIADSFKALSISTFGGNPVSTRGGLATIEYIENHKIVDQVEKVGNYLEEKLVELKDKYPLIGDVRGKGLMLGVELVKEKKEPAVNEILTLFENTKKRGLLIGKGGLYGNVVRIAPPMTVDQGIVDEAIKILDKAFEEI